MTRRQERGSHCAQSTPSKTWPSPEWLHSALELERARNDLYLIPHSIEEEPEAQCGEKTCLHQGPGHSSLGSHLAGQNHLSSRNKSLLFSQKRPSSMEQATAAETKTHSGIHIKANFSLTIHKSRAAFGAPRCHGGPQSPVSCLLSRLLPPSFRSCWSLLDTVKGFNFRKT